MYSTIEPVGYPKVAISLPEMGGLKDLIQGQHVTTEWVAISLPEMGGLKVLKFVIACFVYAKVAISLPEMGGLKVLQPSGLLFVY